MEKKDISQLSVDTIRMLSLDIIERANSGHPGITQGAAPMAYVLFSKFLKFNPHNPKWFNRDRFIMSAGHGSALLYAMLHLSGYNVSMDDLKSFRQYKSITPGHPEFGVTDGVEATTGPLGQGFAMGVGMAMAEKIIGDSLNRKKFKVNNHYTYAIVSDGELMEGITSEAASLAATLKLGKIVYLYDNNNISIEGKTDITFTENVLRRFQAYGWHTVVVEDGNNLKALEKAIEKSKAETEKPSLIVVKTVIGYGTPLADTAKIHGSPLGDENIKKTREAISWPLDKNFFVPEEVYLHFGDVIQANIEKELEWNKLFINYKESNQEEADLMEKFFSGHINPELTENIVKTAFEEKNISTREYSEKVMNLASQYMFEFLGGSADLGPSTKTVIKDDGHVGIGKNLEKTLHFGVREHAMGAIINGMALHGGIIPYASTFLVFSDYMRPSVRLAAMMNTHSIFVFTHDSIAVGEDGPTHQPIEHINSLRMIPNLFVYRPADAKETSACWYEIITKKSPCAIILSRQSLPVLENSFIEVFNGSQKGAYIVEDFEFLQNGKKAIIIATGSEVHIAVDACKILKKTGIDTRVVSMPCYETFMLQGIDYRELIIPPQIKKRVVVEAGDSSFWYKLATDSGVVVGIDDFGESAPGDFLMKKMGFSAENIVETTQTLFK